MFLKINIHDIRQDKSAQLKGELSIDPRELGLVELPGINWNPLMFTYGVTNAGSFLVLEGVMEGLVSLECCRCLRNIDYPLRADVLEQFSHNPPRDEDIWKFHGEEIDVAGALRENILLNLPVKPLCSPDCQGLCPLCGIDKNEGSCNCSSESIDPRLAVLEKLIRK